MKKPKVDKEIFDILGDYNLFVDSDKQIDMPFNVSEVDNNHVTAMRGSTELIADKPFGNTVLECQMREKNEYNYSFKILTDKVKSRMLFRLDEGDGAHWNRHFRIPVNEQQVLTPHFHKYGPDGIMYAYQTNDLNNKPNPLNIHDGFIAFCKESHIIHNNIQLNVQEVGTLPLVFEPERDPLVGILFP